MAAEQLQSIYETADQEMVSQDGKIKVRVARFLKPVAMHVNQAFAIPNTPLLSDVFQQNLEQWPSNVVFQAWNCPQRKWGEWVDRLAKKHEPVWSRTGIRDAILRSTYQVRCNQNLLLGLSEFWCSETNTFVFPWGEATITLEDVMILGGYPVIGEPATSGDLTKELVKVEEALNKCRNEMSSSKARKPGHSTWIKHFMEEETEYEHEAFLSLWLSRYVFPTFRGTTVGKNILPIAVKLSQGIKVALGPAVLATLYHSLRKLRRGALDSSDTIFVTGQFHLLQVWAYERFSLLSPSPPKSLDQGEPRVARWDKLDLKPSIPLVRFVLNMAKKFEWRPYAADLRNWCHRSHYKETEQLVFGGSSLDEELLSFLICLQASELVGFDCREKYLPHRVAMQFGMDQDLPGDVSNFNFTGELVKFFVPPRSFSPGISLRYSNWWKDMMVTRKHALLLRRNGMNTETFEGPGVEENKEDFPSPVVLAIGSQDLMESQASENCNGEGCPSSVTPELSNDEDFVPKSLPCAYKFDGSVTRSKASKTKMRIGENTIASDATSNEVHESIATRPIPEQHVSRKVPTEACFEKTTLSSSIELCRRTPNSGSSNTSAIEALGEKRKMTTRMEGNLQKKMMVQSVCGAAKAVDGKAGESGNNAKPGEIKRENESSFSDPLHKAKPKELIDLSEESSESIEVHAEIGERKMAGDSLNNPIDIDDIDEPRNVDDNLITARSRSPELEQDLEKRVKAIEKKLGL